MKNKQAGKKGAEHPRDEILRIMERIYRYRMTTSSGGNLSVRDGEGNIWITPTSIDKGRLRPDHIVCVKPDGTVSSDFRPSSEFFFHKAIYAARPDVRAIVHAHSVGLVAFSVAKRAPDTRLLHQAWQVCGPAGFAPYAPPGSEALASQMSAVFGQGVHCAIMENHGAVAAGQTLLEAFQRFETLEFAARTIITAGMLGGQVRYLTGDQVALPGRCIEPLPEFDRGPTPERELELRGQLSEFVGRSYRQRLMISTEGSFSARLGEDEFLITPSGVDRDAVGPADLVLVRGGCRERGRCASRAARSHREIYRAHPGVGAIINALSVNATAFGVTGTPLDTRTMTESYMVLREVGLAPFELQFTDAAALARRISAASPALLLANDGVLVTGSSPLEAFDRLEVLEATAEVVINARPIGEAKPMTSEEIVDLKGACLM